MIRANTKYASLIASLLLYLFVHWTFAYIFGETPVNIMKLGGSVGNTNYAINVTSFIVITIVFGCLITFFIKDKIRWVIGVFIGTFISAALNALFVQLSYYLMIKSLV